MAFENCKIAFLMIYTDKVQSEAHIRSKNYLSYIGTELHSFKNGDVLWGTDEDSLIREAAALGFEYALLVREGTIFLSWTSFLEEIEKVWTPDHFCLGHILDRGDRYFEIHNQCIFLSLSKMVSLGFPSFQKHLDTPEGFQKVIRSQENFHDDYTPLWIEAGREKITFERISRGSRWISQALEGGFKISPFPKSAREMKEFLYPEHQESYDSNKIYVKDLVDTDAQSFFMYNTEQLVKNDKIQPLNTLIMPASGLMPLYILRQYGYAAQPSIQSGCTRIVIYDISHIQLELYKKLMLDWDGRHYRTFVESFLGHNLIKGQQWEAFDRTLFKKYFGDEEVFRKWLFDLRTHCEFTFVRANALAKNFKTYWWLENSTEDSAYLSLSNIFHYWPTSIDLSYQYRLNTLNQLMEQLGRVAPGMWVNFCRPEVSGEGKIRPRSHLIQAQDYLPEIPVAMPWENLPSINARL